MINVPCTKRYGLMAVMQKMEIREIPEQTILYGYYNPITKDNPPNQITLNNTIDNKATRYQVHFSLVAGYNPPSNVLITIANYKKVLSTASTNYPCVTKVLYASGPSLSDIVQMNGRTNRAYTQCGITFCQLPVIETMMRYELLDPIMPRNPDLNVFVEAYKALSKPETIVSSTTKNTTEND